MIYRLFATKIWILNKAWQIITVSIAAQIGTFPIAVFYFNQFPNYFILTNLIVIPLAGFIIYTGIILLLTSSIAPIAWFVSKVLYAMLWLLNSSVEFVEMLPGSTWKGISLQVHDVFLLFVLIILGYVYFNLKIFKYLKYALITICVIAVFFSIRNHENLIQKKIIVYNIRNYSAIDFIDGRCNYFVCSEELINDESKYMFNVANNRTDCGIKQQYFVNNFNKSFKNNNFCKKFNCFKFYDKTIAILNKIQEKQISNQKIKIDYLIISENPNLDIRKTLNYYNPKLIIFDSSNKFWMINKWKKECKELNVDFYSVADSGAFVLNF